MKKQNTLADTVGEIDIAEVEAQTKAIFGKQNGHSLPIGDLLPVPGTMQQEIKRPRIEMPFEDYQKLKVICAHVNEDISKMLYKVVKTWLDGVRPKI